MLRLEEAGTMRRALGLHGSLNCARNAFMMCESSPQNSWIGASGEEVGSRDCHWVSGAQHCLCRTQVACELGSVGTCRGWS